ncbi:MAG: FAD:protein FMN transferase [Pseudonocardiaceae bacterium]
MAADDRFPLAATPLRRVEHIMGLPISLDLRDPSPPLREAARQAFDWLREVDRRFSPFQAGSEVRRLGRGELTPAQASPELVEVLALCAQYEQASGGAFRAWLPGPVFDPSGVVKGWAVQRAGQILRDAGARRFCLNAGGDVLTAGEPERGRAWRVGIRHPARTHQICAVFSIRDGAVATSGTYERGAHIIDGRTGHPTRDLVSLTVIAPDLTTADATSTAAFAMGTDGIAWANAQPNCLVFAIDTHHQVRSSTELTNTLAPRTPSNTIGS